MVGPVGIEPTTLGLKVPCPSTCSQSSALQCESATSGMRHPLADGNNTIQVKRTFQIVKQILMMVSLSCHAQCLNGDAMEYANASVARKASGKGWRAALHWKDESGKWRSTTKALKASTKREAKRELAELLAQSAPEAAGASETVMDYARAYVERKAALKAIQPATATDYRKCLNAWSPYLEGIMLGNLKTRAIEDALQRMLETDSAQTVLKRYVVLNMVLSHAVRTGEIAENPMRHIPRPKPSPSVPNAILGDDLERLKDRLQQLPPRPWVAGVFLCLYAGLRAEEACGLTLADIDLDSGTGWVRRAIGYARGGAYVAPPKNRKPRDFPLAEPLRAFLRRWIEIRASEYDAPTEPSSWLLSVDQTMPTVRQVGSKWSMLCEVEDFKGQDGRKPTLHDLRHTFATCCVKAGMDIKTLQSILGHSSAAITLDIYASADSGAKSAAASLIESAI